jgi:hypothetical protein
MSQTSNFNSRKGKSNLFSFKLEDIQLQTENGEVADVTVNLDYIDRLKPSELKNVVPIANSIKHYLTNYPNNSNDFFEVPVLFWNCPNVSNTVNPAGKRGVTTSLINS